MPGVFFDSLHLLRFLYQLLCLDEPRPNQARMNMSLETYERSWRDCLVGTAENHRPIKPPRMIDSFASLIVNKTFWFLWTGLRARNAARGLKWWWKKTRKGICEVVTGTNYRERITIYTLVSIDSRLVVARERERRRVKRGTELK